MPKNMTMVGSGLWDGMDNGVSRDDFLDNILSILDFPMEILDGDGLGGDWDAKPQCLESISSKAFPELPAVSQVVVDNCDLDVLPNSSIASDKTSQQKQLPNFVEEISRTSIPLDSTDGKDSSLLPVPGSISVLENSSSCSTEKSMSINNELLIPMRTRRKRPRPSTCNPCLMMSCTSSKKNLKPKKSKEKKKKKLSQLSGVMEIKENSFERPVATNKCTHCEVTETPQWREGPMGPKTLCNACGVRYRSGRLFPEYRPAASPTFVPSLHSNSHKKVIEIRNKTIQEEDMAETECAMSPPPEFVPMSSYLFDII